LNSAQPRRLVGEQPERRRVRLREAERGEAGDLLVDRLRRLARRSVGQGAGHELVLQLLDR
jgi:hypothetical protein